jgi:hypothetical protein
MLPFEVKNLLFVPEEVQRRKSWVGGHWRVRIKRLRLQLLRGNKSSAWADQDSEGGVIKQRSFLSASKYLKGLRSCRKNIFFLCF